MGLLFNYSFSVTEVLWSFSIFLESVAILPQLFMLQRTGEAETITTHYLAALGAYRALYIPNWIYRYVILEFDTSPPGVGRKRVFLYARTHRALRLSWRVVFHDTYAKVT